MHLFWTGAAIKPPSSVETDSRKESTQPTRIPVSRPPLYALGACLQRKGRQNKGLEAGAWCLVNGAWLSDICKQPTTNDQALRMYHFAASVAKRYTRNATGEQKPKRLASARHVCMDRRFERPSAFQSRSKAPSLSYKSPENGAKFVFCRPFACSALFASSDPAPILFASSRARPLKH